MQYRIFDVSGGITPAMVEAAIKECQVGDHIVAFDNRVYDIGPMLDVARIRETLLQLVPGGGTDVNPALELVRSLVTENSYATIYTDGYMPEPKTNQPNKAGLKYTFAIYPGLADDYLLNAMNSFGRLPATQVRRI